MLRIQNIKKDLIIKSGSGGNGSVSFSKDQGRTSSGGNGGNGGNVFLKCSSSLSDLSHLKSRKVAARSGSNGENSSKTGKQGEDITIMVPCGTRVYFENTRDFQNKEMDCPLSHEEQILLTGGSGGKGNESYAKKFKERTHLANRGEPGKEERISLASLPAVSAVILGAENSGKSTLLNAITSSKAIVRPFPFTTKRFEQGTFEFDWRLFLVVEVSTLLSLENPGKKLGEYLEKLLSFSLVVWMIDLSTEESIKKSVEFRKECIKSPLLKEKRHFAVIRNADKETEENKQSLKKKLELEEESELFYFNSKEKEFSSFLQGKISLLSLGPAGKKPSFFPEPAASPEEWEVPLISVSGKTIVVKEGHLSRLYAGKGSHRPFSEKQVKRLILQNKPLYNQLISAGVGPGWEIKMGDMIVEW